MNKYWHGVCCEIVISIYGILAMQMFMAIRSVASETAKLAFALGAILIPLFLLAIALEHVRGGTAAPVDSVISLLKGVWF